MRTKHLLWALALPAVFAACTNDDFESVIQSNDALQGRPMAGDVKLNFDFGEADTRLNSEFQFEVGDEIGATLMDEYKEDGVPDYNIMGLPASGNVYSFVNYIQTNYRYTNTESGWTNSNLLCSGNYFFYYPYMTTLNTRVAFEKYLNPNQVLEANTSAASHEMINENQMYIGYKLVEGATEGSTQVLNVSMSPVFAFPYFEIMCTDSEPVTIQKIALQYIKKDKDMPLMAVVDPTNEGRKITTVDNVKYVDFEKDPTSAVCMRGNNATDKPKLDKDAVIAARQIQVTFPEGTTTKNGSPVRTYMVIPSGNYSDDDAVELLIYTDKGLVTADLSVAHENTGIDGGQNNVTNDVAMGEVSGTMDKVRTIKITFDEVAINNPDEFTTTSTQDLDTYVSWSAKIGGTKNMWIKSTNKDTELSAATVATLAENQNITMNILGDITIAEDVKSEDYKAAKINFLGGNVSTSYKRGEDGKIAGLEDLADHKGQTIYNKATLTIPSMSDPEKGDLTFHNNGNITLTGISYGIKFVNEGTMTINAGANRSTKLTMSNEDEKKDYLENYGTLNINGNVVADNTVTTNNGWINNYANATVNIAQGATITARIDNKKHKSEVEYGKIVVNGTWNIFGKGGKNDGLIEVNGTLRVPEGEEKYENVMAWTYPLKGTHIPTIKNNGNVMRVTNNGLVELSANSAYSTSGITGAKGRVDNTNISTRATISKDETIFVKVTAAANVKDLNDKLQNASAELVVFENAGSLTLDAADLAENKTTFELVIPEVEVRGNLDITTPAGYTLNIHAVSIGTKFKVLSGTTKLTARTKVDLGTTNRGAYVTVEEGAKLEVENNAELTSSCDLQFEGEGLIGNYGAITNVKKGEEPNLVEGSRDVVYKE